MKRSVRLYIDGTVQGIFFREFIKKNAEENNLKGFTRNLHDGKVEDFLEGNIDDVDRMIEVCRKGPRHAMIKSVKIKPETFQDFKEFKVLHI